LAQLSHAEGIAKNAKPPMNFEPYDLDTVDGLSEGAFQGVHSGSVLPVFIMIQEDGRKQQLILEFDGKGNESIEVRNWNR